MIEKRKNKRQKKNMIWPNMIEAQYKNNAKHEIFWYKTKKQIQKQRKHEICWYEPKKTSSNNEQKRNLLVQNEKNKLKKRTQIRKWFFNIKTKTNFESRKTQKSNFE